MRKPKSSPSLRDKLSANFIAAFESDFEAHGTEVIQQLREKHPDRYSELAAKLIIGAEPPTSLSDFSKAESVEDVGRQLLMQLGVDESRITDWMIEKAVAANGRLVAELESIISVGAGLAASFTGEDYAELKS